MKLFLMLCRVIVQVVCSYSTLPLYAIVTQVNCSFPKYFAYLEN